MNPEARQLIKTAREQLCFAQQKLLPSRGAPNTNMEAYKHLDEVIESLEQILIANPLPRTDKLI